MKRLLSIFTLLLAIMPLWAQRTSEPTAAAKTAGEGEINRQDFFDPTRKTEKEKEYYQFTTDWRLEVGYAQNQQRSLNNTYANPFLHGVKVGATVDFNLPYHFSIQTGLALGLTYGQIEQHWRSLTQESVQAEYIRHGYNQYYLEVPVRAFYRINLWKELNLFFYGGPKLQIGLAELDWQKHHLSEQALNWLSQTGVPTANHDRYSAWQYTDKNGDTQVRDRELKRCNIQMGLGGGLEWAQYRLVAGYDFGLNNLANFKPTPTTHMWQWGWYVSFAYKF